MDALSTFFPSLFADKSSSSSSVYAQWSSELFFNPPKDIKVSSGSLSIIVSLDLWWVAHIFPEGSLSMPSKICSSNIGLLTFDPILGFPSSHNSLPKPYFPFLLRKGGFGDCGEAFGMLQMCSHVGVSFQLIWDMLLTLQNPRHSNKCSGWLLVPHILGEIMILRSPFFTLNERENCHSFLGPNKRRG